MTNNELSTNKLSKIIATLGCLGKVRYFPGTIGSLATYPLFIAIYFMLNIYCEHLHYHDILKKMLAMLAIWLILLFIGIYSAGKYIEDDTDKDPKEVIIDEVVGQFLILTLSMPAIIISSNFNIFPYNFKFFLLLFNFILPFLLFRFFDILKPWPIKWFDKNIKGGIGIVLDDVIAAIIATVINYAILLIVGDYIGYIYT